MTFAYNVFLSHNSKDKPAVEAIAILLQRKYSLNCWLDKWNLVPGEPWQEALEQALDQCETVAVFVGPHEISPWENEEMRSALEARVHDPTRRVIPVLLPGAPDSKDLQFPRFLTRLTWVDFRGGLHDEEALYRLYWGITGTKPEGYIGRQEARGLPFGSYIPFVRNEQFTGREADLQALADNLLSAHSTNTVISQALIGMGGIGKTQLAAEFAWRYCHRFKGVHWLDLRDTQGLDGAIALCGTKMGYTQVDQRELIASTLKSWIEDGPRLLILDNFEEVAQANDVLVRFQHPSLRLLVTSRRKDFPKSAGLRVQQLGLFSEAESLDFLDKTLDQEETLAAKKTLAAKLGCLPLGLQLAAGYINIKKQGIAGYLKELADISKLQTLQAEWFKELDVTSPTLHDQSLFGTFQLSWRELKEATHQKVFLIAGYLAPNTPIPLEILKETLELEDDALTKALYRLNALGVLPSENVLPSIHPLLAAYSRTLAASPDVSSKELLEKLAKTLARLAWQADQQMDQTGTLGWFAPLRSHVLSVGEFTEQGGVQTGADLLGSLGYYLQRIADYQGAKSANERALKIDEATLGPDHPDVARDVNNLGEVLQELGDLAGARAAYERALKIDEAAFGPEHPNVARDVNNLGDVLQELGDLAGARAAFERALKLDEVAFGPDHHNVAIRVNNLGSVLYSLGDLAGARAAFERALKIDEVAFGSHHPEVAIRVNNLGFVLQDQGDLDGARAAFERALKIDEVAFGPDHPNVAIRINNMGGVLRALNDLAGARAAFERALKILIKFLPEGHPNIKRVQRNLDIVSKQDNAG